MGPLPEVRDCQPALTVYSLIHKKDKKLTDLFWRANQKRLKRIAI
ncbi:hypothetical protein AHMF7616_00769 [Adhaeribacter pallidiroseus]|uniref:Uncharacterized protein n=1 Tax=Adhaeribacter pallidiroseus TaxID=2072847 RepID=A0A369QIQ8_9BACT|nr:hypothetical protein AHMF7616_00769 [Adhaeribacter pallidiroseus]